MARAGNSVSFVLRRDFSDDSERGKKVKAPLVGGFLLEIQGPALGTQ